MSSFTLLMAEGAQDAGPNMYWYVVTAMWLPFMIAAFITGTTWLIMSLAEGRADRGRWPLRTWVITLASVFAGVVLLTIAMIIALYQVAAMQ